MERLNKLRGDGWHVAKPDDGPPEFVIERDVPIDDARQLATEALAECGLNAIISSMPRYERRNGIVVCSFDLLIFATPVVA